MHVLWYYYYYYYYYYYFFFFFFFLVFVPIDGARDAFSPRFPFNTLTSSTCVQA